MTVLPAYRHVPGQNQRHADGLLEQIVATALAETRSENAQMNPAWKYALVLFDNGFYWECHEILEGLWSKALPNSRERFLIQGLIHVANGALKRTMHRDNAAERLADLASASFARAFLNHSEPVMGLHCGLINGLSQSMLRNHSLPPLTG